jgi:hypothetical protein
MVEDSWYKYTWTLQDKVQVSGDDGWKQDFENPNVIQRGEILQASMANIFSNLKRYFEK